MSTVEDFLYDVMAPSRHRSPDPSRPPIEPQGPRKPVGACQWRAAVQAHRGNLEQYVVEIFDKMMERVRTKGDVAAAIFLTDRLAGKEVEVKEAGGMSLEALVLMSLGHTANTALPVSTAPPRITVEIPAVAP